MKKTIILLALTILTLAAACQGKDKIFTVPVKLQGGFYVGTDPVLHLTLPTGGSMTYPGVGIPVSTGSAWGTSITNNSANWNTAFGWGNHAGLYRPVAWVPTFAQITSKPTTLAGYGITDAALATHNHNALYRPITYVPTWNEVTGKPVFHAIATTGSWNDLKDVPAMMELEVALPSLLGIKLPVLTQAQISALVPVKGLLLFNDTDGVLQIYNGTIWKTIITNN